MCYTASCPLKLDMSIETLQFGWLCLSVFVLYTIRVSVVSILTSFGGENETLCAYLWGGGGGGVGEEWGAFSM